MKYFTINELTKSSTALSKGINNTPTKDIENKLIQLVNKVLDPLREWYKKPIVVTSGYRCPALNKAVKGAVSSQHMKGEAADIKSTSISENKKLFDYIKNNLDFDQLIWEYGGKWIHVSYKSNGNRKQVLSINN